MRRFVSQVSGKYVSYLTMGNNKIVEPGFRHICTPSCVAQEILQVSTQVKYALEKRIGLTCEVCCALNHFLIRVVKSSGDSS